MEISNPSESTPWTKRIGKFQVTQQIVAAKGCQVGDGKQLLMGMGASFWGKEKVVELDNGAGSTPCEYTENHWTVHFKGVNFIWIIYFNFLKKEERDGPSSLHWDTGTAPNSPHIHYNLIIGENYLIADLICISLIMSETEAFLSWIPVWGFSPLFNWLVDFCLIHSVII